MTRGLMPCCTVTVYARERGLSALRETAEAGENDRQNDHHVRAQS